MMVAPCANPRSFTSKTLLFICAAANPAGAGHELRAPEREVGVRDLLPPERGAQRVSGGVGA